jgi:hypothetical protein
MRWYFTFSAGSFFTQQVKKEPAENKNPWQA